MEDKVLDPEPLREQEIMKAKHRELNLSFINNINLRKKDFKKFKKCKTNIKINIQNKKIKRMII